MSQPEANYWVVTAMQLKEVAALFAVIFLLLYTHIKVIPKRDENVKEKLIYLTEEIEALKESISDLRALIERRIK